MLYEGGSQPRADKSGQLLDTFRFWAPSNAAFVRVGFVRNGKRGAARFEDLSIAPTQLDPGTCPPLAAADEELLTAAIDTMRGRAVKRDRINFDEVEALARCSADPKGVHAGIRLAVASLADRHSSFLTVEEIREFLGDTATVVALLQQDGYLPLGRLNGDSLIASFEFEYPEARLLEREGKRFGLLDLPGFTNSYELVLETFIDSAQRAIAALEANEPIDGWVVDLRHNDGGATPAHVSSVGPLLGDRNVAYYLSAGGDTVAAYRYRVSDGAYVEVDVDSGDSLVYYLSKLAYSSTARGQPLAVLIDRGTSSAAEGLAVLLMGEPNARLFGRPSSGQTTGNELYLLPGPTLLNLAESYLANARGVRFEGPIEPDELVSREGAGDGPILDAALHWLNAGLHSRK